MDGRPTPNDPDKLLRRSRSAAISAAVAGGIATAGLITGISHAGASTSKTMSTTSSTSGSSSTRTHRSSSGSSSSSDDSTGSSSTGGIGAAPSMRQAQGGSNGS